MNRYCAKIMEIKAKEFGCSVDDFFSKDQILYLIDEDVVFKILTFGTSAVIAGSQKVIDPLKKELDGFNGIELFDAPSLYLIDSTLHENEHRLSEMYDFFIPSDTMTEYGENRDCPFTVKRLDKEAICKIEHMENYENALCQGKASSLNELAYSAMDKGRIISIAGSSSNSDRLWWIGVDTEPDYRRKGLASFLVNKVACDVIKLGKIPIYPTWYSNIASRLTAIKAGFVPGFVEIGCEQLWKT